MDLCIRCSEDVHRSLQQLHELGYMCCAVEHYVRTVGDLKTVPQIDFHSGTASYNGAAELQSEVHLQSNGTTGATGTANPAVTPLHATHLLSGRQLTILSRITLDSNCNQLRTKYTSAEVQKYDIVAVRVHTDDQIRQIVKLPIDIVQISASSKIRYTHALLRELYSSGLTVELVLNDDLKGNIYHSFHLNRCIRNKPVLISSGGQIQPFIRIIEQCKTLYRLNTRHIWLAARRVLSRAAARKYRNSICIYKN